MHCRYSSTKFVYSQCGLCPLYILSQSPQNLCRIIYKLFDLFLRNKFLNYLNIITTSGWLLVALKQIYYWKHALKKLLAVFCQFQYVIYQIKIKPTIKTLAYWEVDFGVLFNRLPSTVQILIPTCIFMYYYEVNFQENISFGFIYFTSNSKYWTILYLFSLTPSQS